MTAQAQGRGAGKASPGLLSRGKHLPLVWEGKGRWLRNPQLPPLLWGPKSACLGDPQACLGFSLGQFHVLLGTSSLL